MGFFVLHAQHNVIVKRESGMQGFCSLCVRLCGALTAIINLAARNFACRYACKGFAFGGAAFPITNNHGRRNKWEDMQY